MSYLGHLLVDIFVGLLELLLGFRAQLLLAVQLLCKLRRALSLFVQHLLDALSLLNFVWRGRSWERLATTRGNEGVSAAVGKKGGSGVPERRE